MCCHNVHTDTSKWFNYQRRWDHRIAFYFSLCLHSLLTAGKNKNQHWMSKLGFKERYINVGDIHHNLVEKGFWPYIWKSAVRNHLDLSERRLLQQSEEKGHVQPNVFIGCINTVRRVLFLCRSGKTETSWWLFFLRIFVKASGIHLWIVLYIQKVM